MAQKFWYYIDWGSGYSEVDIYNNELKLSWVRGELNDFITRKKLSGSFVLKDYKGKNDFSDAETFFLTNVNEEAPIRIYENGDIISGILKYEGWGTVEGEWDFKEKKVTFSEFRTNDEYTELLTAINNKSIGEELIGFVSFGDFAAQGKHVNANKLYSFTVSGGNFILNPATPTSLANIGRCTSDLESGEIIFYDNVNSTLNSYLNLLGQWSLIRSLNLNSPYLNASVSATGAGQVILVFDGRDEGETYNLSGGTFVLAGTGPIGTVKFPSTCWTGSRTLIVDEGQKTLRTINGNGISLGDIRKPQICTIDSATETIAFIDSKQRKLIAYRYNGGAFTQIGNALPITGIFMPTINSRSGTNTIVMHDPILGKLRGYTFNGTNWSQDVNDYNIGGGYMSTVSSTGTDIFLAISDTHVFNTSTTTNVYGGVNSLLLLNNIWGSGVGEYEMQSTATGATKDPTKIIFGTVSDISDNKEDSGKINTFKFTLNDVLKYHELFQDYWYIEDIAGAWKIKYTQPDLFSSFGTDIDISSLDLATELNQRIYKSEFKIAQEELIFNNSNSIDFSGNKIIYPRNTSVIKENAFPFTTDFEFLIEIFTGQIIERINTAGIIIYYADTSTGRNLAVSGNGIISGVDTKNYLLSQSQIYNDHWNTYRYTDRGNLTINGSSVSVGSSVKDIIEYPEVNVSESDMSITEFPNSIGNLIWGGGIPKSFIMELILDLDKREYTILSRLHDI
jgi:hypothetical protein